MKINHEDIEKAQQIVDRLRGEEFTQSLCFRCEYRAQYFERGHAPRLECSDIGSAKYSCYMYRPVKPVVTELNEDESRPQFSGSLLAGRSHAVRVMDGELALREYEDGSAIYWKPKRRKPKSKKGKKK